MPVFVVCEASVSLRLRSKERPKNGIFDVLPVRKVGRASKIGRGGGRRRGWKETLADKPSLPSPSLSVSCFLAPQPHGSACYSQATVIVVCYSFVLRYRKLQSSSGQLSLPINVLRLCRLSIVAFVASSFRKCLEHVVAKRVIAALYSLLVCSFVSVFLFCCKLELERIVKAKKKIKKALLSVPRICFKQPG